MIDLLKHFKKPELKAPSIEEVITVKQINPKDDLQTQIGTKVMNLFFRNLSFATDYINLQMLLNDREEFAAEALSLYATTISVALINPKLSCKIENEFYVSPFLDALQKSINITFQMKNNPKLKNVKDVDQTYFEGAYGAHIKAALNAIQANNFTGNYLGIVRQYAEIIMKENGTSALLAEC